jgi:hypothetical protein
MQTGLGGGVTASAYKNYLKKLHHERRRTKKESDFKDDHHNRAATFLKHKTSDQHTKTTTI